MTSAESVVQVFAPVGADGLGRKGSGQLIGDRLVLTARHVIQDTSGPCQVRGLGAGEWVSATVLWAGEGDEQDGALLRVDGALGDVVRVALGRLGGGERVVCEATGFPWAQQLERRDDGAVCATEHAVGMVDAVSGRAAGGARCPLTIHIQGSSPERRVDGSPWAGMSGAGLVCEGLLVGVVTADPKRFGPDRLLAVSLAQLLAAPGFAGALRAARGEDVVLDVVEARGVLERAYDPPPERARHSSAILLSARYGVVPFRSRDELQTLRDWAAGEQDVAVAVLHGSGGVGKTRLARELCRELATDGWVTGPLSTRSWEPQRLERLAGVDAPLLLVIDDYAETRRGDLVDALGAIVRHAARGPRRLVLTTRRLGDWWAQLQRACPDSEIRELLEHALPVAVAAVDDSVPARVEAYEQAVAAFSAHTGLVGADTVTPDLSDGTFDTVLFVHMAALSALPGAADGPLPAAARSIRSALLDATLERERRYWSRMAQARSPALALETQALEYAVAVATLTASAPAMTPADAQQTALLLEAVPDIASDGALRHRAARWLHDLYPLRGAWIAPLEPDLLGEALVAHVLTELPGLADDLLERVDDASAERALTVLTRASAQHPVGRATLRDVLDQHVRKLAGIAIDVAQQAGDPIGVLLADALARNPDGELARTLLEQIPQHTVALREAAVVAATQALASADQPSDRATLLVAQSHRLSELGRREDALTAIDEAVAIRRQLAAARPDAFLPDLAMSLNNQSGRLSELGRREDALTASDEAVGVYRQLAAARPDAFLPDLAASLNNQSGRLSELGRREDALTASDEAVGVYRQLAAARPDAFLPDLAASLNNQSTFLSELGRREDALTAIDEAVGVYRQLAAARPDAFLPDLAASLNNQSTFLSELGRREDALTAIDEAVGVYRQLAAARPDAFLPNLAASLNNQSTFLSELGRREDALTAIDEAVGVYRQLAAARPDAFLPNLAASLNNQSTFLSELGRREDALTAIDEAVAIRRQLAAARPDAFLPDLAASLNNQSTFLSELGRREDALTAIDEAVAIRRQLAAARPDAFLPNLAASLNNQSGRLSELGRREDALTASDEAVAIRRQLAAARPDAFLPNLAASLNNQSGRLSELGRREDALTAIDEAVAIRRQLAAARPDAFLPNLAASLNNQSTFLSELGRREDALTAIDEAVAIRRQLAAARPDAFLPDLAASLNNQSGRLSELGRREDALTAIDEALRLVLPLLERAPYFLPDAGLRLVRGYVARCQEADCDPDANLLGRMHTVLLAAGLVEAGE